ncbi:MAG: PH domain-containing protein [Acidobacteriota bacterium]
MPNPASSIDRLTDLLIRWLRVPSAPQLPPGDPSTARVFQGGRNYWRLLVIKWWLKQAGTLTALTLAWIYAHQVEWFAVFFPALFYHPLRAHSESVLFWFRLLEQFAWVSFLFQLPLSYLRNHVAYRLRWYVITDRAARLRRGWLQVHEQTLTLANVQRVELHQGPLQRWLGLCSLELHTAGGGDHSESGDKEDKQKKSLRIAEFEGIDLADAIEIRDRLEVWGRSGISRQVDPTSDTLRRLVESSQALRNSLLGITSSGAGL